MTTISRARGTLFGFVAIMCWSVYGSLVIIAGETPPYLTLSIFFTAAAAALLLRRIIMRKGFRDLFAIPPATLLLGILGLFGSNAFFVLAISVGADPVAVSIISFAWPILMVAIVVAAGIARINVWDAVALALGFTGVAVTSMKGGALVLHWGIVLAFLGALCWALYSGLRKLVPAGPNDLMSAVLIICAVAAWIIHFALGEPREVTTGSMIALLLVGIFPVGLANLLWDLGARHGDTVLLAGLAFIEPVISAGFIIFLLGKPGTIWHLIGLTLILAAVGSSLLGERARRQTEGHRSVTVAAEPPAG